MPITTLDEVFSLLNQREVPFNKSNFTCTTGLYATFARTGIFPPAFTNPTAVAICDETTVGALPLPTRTGSQKRTLLAIDIASSQNVNTYIIEDRLIHMAGLDGTLTTAQTVGVDASVTGSNMVNRIGASDYSELKWFLEWYTSTGSTAVVANVDVTFADNTTGTIAVSVGSSFGSPRRAEIRPDTGKFIKSVNSVTLSATTGTAGNFGVTLSRFITKIPTTLPSKFEYFDWATLRAREIPDNACLNFIVMPSSTSSGDLRGSLYIGVK